MKIAICPGSFDPVTNGHIDIIRRAAEMFDAVIVVVMINFAKEAHFSVKKRMDFLQRATKDIENVRVDCYDGLLASYAKEHNAQIIVKGLRAVSDFEYEFQMALTNNKLNPELETVFLTSLAENMYLSSSIVRQVAALGGDISDFVPECILGEIESKFKRRNKNDD